MTDVPTPTRERSASDRARLIEGAVRLNLDLDEHQIDRLIGLRDLVLKWNRVHNLTAIVDPDAMVEHHLLDSLAALPIVLRHLPDDAAVIVDVGSGAGFPGLPWAIAARRLIVHLVEPAGKKAAFMRQALARLGISNATVHDRRIQDLRSTDVGGVPDVITARAFADLGDLILAVDHLVGPATRITALKGARSDDEVARWQASTDPTLARYALEETVRLDVPGLDAQRRLIIVRRGHADA